jgi:transcriptional regulator with XRE-family HTH domain
MNVNQVNKIKKIREAKNLTQAQLAAMIKVHSSLISKIETGDSEGSISTLRRMADALGVTVAELLDAPRCHKSNSKGA